MMHLVLLLLICLVVGPSFAQNLEDGWQDNRNCGDPWEAPTDDEATVDNLCWLFRSAEMGDPLSQYLLGLHYAQGKHAAQNWIEATRWFKAAAEKGFYNAQLEIGIAYLHGTGIPQDIVRGCAWISVANAQHPEYAHSYLADSGSLGAVGKKYCEGQSATAAQRKAAAKLAHEYWEKYVLPFRN